MALTNFNGSQFIRTLEIIINHIDKYYQKSTSLPLDMHYKELQDTVFTCFPNDSEDKLSTRKQINEFIKLGFINPKLYGYSDFAKKYILSNTDIERKQIFSDIVYTSSSFNSSVKKDDKNNNQIKFLINTLINRKPDKNGLRLLSGFELTGLMQLDISCSSYAKEKDIIFNSQWANYIEFKKRKYNQIRHLKSIIRNLNFLNILKKGEDYYICLAEDSKNILPAASTKRDPYRFANMRKAVLDESNKIYGKSICWLTKKESEGLVVSHIYASADALRNWDVSEAYDPNNALLLAPGDVDQYFDKKKITIDPSGNVIFSNLVRKDFKEEVRANNWHIDSIILNKNRLNYLHKHNLYFNKKNN